MGNRYDGAAQASSNQSGGQRRAGPYLDLYAHGGFVLTERGKSREVIPDYDGDELRIGCTTISRKALEEIIKLVESDK